MKLAPLLEDNKELLLKIMKKHLLGKEYHDTKGNITGTIVELELGKHLALVTLLVSIGSANYSEGMYKHFRALVDSDFKKFGYDATQIIHEFHEVYTNRSYQEEKQKYFNETDPTT
jgi:hypothetical protein